MFILGFGLGFWAFLVLMSILFFVCTENEWGGRASLLVITVLCVLNWVFHIPVFQYIYHNPLLTTLWVIGYFAIGTGWSVIKWWRYVKRQLEKYYDSKREFIKSNNIKGVGVKDLLPEEFKKKWTEQVQRTYGKYKIELNPQISEHKMSIYIWIAYWPFSMIWTVINDPVRRICRFIYEEIRDLLQSISDRIWRDAKQDLVDNTDNE